MTPKPTSAKMPVSRPDRRPGGGPTPQEPFRTFNTPFNAPARAGQGSACHAKNADSANSAAVRALRSAPFPDAGASHLLPAFRFGELVHPIEAVGRALPCALR